MTDFVFYGDTGVASFVLDLDVVDDEWLDNAYELRVSASGDDLAFRREHFGTGADLHPFCDTFHQIRIAGLAELCDPAVLDRERHPLARVDVDAGHRADHHALEIADAPELNSPR